MKRLPIMLSVGTVVLLCGIYLWQRQTGDITRQAWELQLRVLDADGYPLAGAEIVRLHELRQEVLGVSDAFGIWHGHLPVAQDNLLELRIKKVSMARVWQASRSYRIGQGKRQDSVRLPATSHSAVPRRGHVRVEADEPYVQQALHTWWQRAGLGMAAEGEHVLSVQDEGKGQLRVSLASATSKLFSFQVSYQVLGSAATVQKILRGIYAHSARAYTAWYEEETQHWHVYNPAGFWKLRPDAVLVNAQGRQFSPHAQQSRDQRQLVLSVGEGESVCSQRECIVYSSHIKQAVY